MLQSHISSEEFVNSLNVYKEMNITFHIREVSETVIRISTEQGQCAASYNYNIPELVRITKKVFGPVRNGKRLEIYPKPFTKTFVTKT